MLKVMRFIKREERGATAIEYAFVASLISIAIVVAITLLGDNVESSYNDTAQQVRDATQGAGGN